MGPGRLRRRAADPTYARAHRGRRLAVDRGGGPGRDRGRDRRLERGGTAVVVRGRRGTGGTGRAALLLQGARPGPDGGRLAARLPGRGRPHHRGTLPRGASRPDAGGGHRGRRRGRRTRGRAPAERRPRAAAGHPPHADRRARLRHRVRADRGGVVVGDRAVPRAVRAARDQRRHRWRGTLRLRAARRPRPPRGRLPRHSLPALAFVGLADVAANGTYSVAAQHGPVTVAAVLASLYPVVTALAARGFLSERLRGIQAAGAGLALVGTVLLATG